VLAPGKILEKKQKTKKPCFVSLLGHCEGCDNGTQAADVTCFGTSSVLHVLVFCSWVTFQCQMSTQTNDALILALPCVSKLHAGACHA